MIAELRRAAIDARFREFMSSPRYPCLAGKGVVNSRHCALGVYGTLGSVRSAKRLARDLDRFVERVVAAPTTLQSFVAVFPENAPNNELEFEQRLWRQLEYVTRFDRGRKWDPTASDDPEDTHFAFSFASHAMFIIGLHSQSSRMARRFSWPALVFNPHSQFARLREDGRFNPLRAAIREREIALQGSLNPNLADFGEASEARQYSGRATEGAWRCPFHAEHR